MRCFAILLVTCALGSGVAAAQGAPLKPAAKVHQEAALKAYDAKDYDTAIHEFEVAYEIDPNPALLYAAAQAYRKTNRCAEALVLYRRFVAAAKTQAQVKAGNAEIETCEALIEQHAPPPAPEPAPAPPPAPAAPVAAPPAPSPPIVAPAPAAASTHDTPWYRDPLGDGLTGAGVVAVGVGIGFLVMASSSQHRADTAEFRDDFVHDLDEATTRRRIGAVSLGVGAALVAGGIVVYLRRDHRGADVVGATDGHAIYVSGRF